MIVNVFTSALDYDCQLAKKCGNNQCWYKWVACYGADVFYPGPKIVSRNVALVKKYGKSHKPKLRVYQGTNDVGIRCDEYLCLCERGHCRSNHTES